jgi:hypothetical protein
MRRGAAAAVVPRHAISFASFAGQVRVSFRSGAALRWCGSYQVIPMVNVPDNITLAQLCTKAAEALARAGLDRRIDIYREVEIDDPAVRLMLGRPHRLRVRVKITATSLLFEAGQDQQQPAGTATQPLEGDTVIGTMGPDSVQPWLKDSTP